MMAWGLGCRISVVECRDRREDELLGVGGWLLAGTS